MNRGQRVLFFLAAGALLLPAVLSGQKSGPKKEPKPVKVEAKDLSPKYQDFLKLTTYIMTEKEKDVFFQLTGDRDRDIFVQSFWKIRDPTPGTPENEYKTEIEKRYDHANRTFFRGAGRPGWQTDRGRFYIILGPPASTERFYGQLGITPCEVWYYYTDGRNNLPNHFGLVFFQKSGAGDFRLYDPTVDGPKSLMWQTPEVASLSPEDYEGQYDALKEMAPTLADMAISLIPGEYGYGYTPSPRNTMLIADIIRSPKADINPTYATHFLSYRGLVTTEYITNYVESEAAVAVIPDPIVKANFLSYSIKPARVNAKYNETRDQYYADFTVSVSVKVPGKTPDEFIFQSTRNFPVYFDPKDESRVRANGLSVEDSFPVAEGKYKLTILLQNEIGKEFSIFEKDIEVPPDTGKPRIAGPLFGYRVQDYPLNMHLPFKALERKLVVDPTNTFVRNDTVICFFQVLNAGPDLSEAGQVRLTLRGASGKPENLKTQTVFLKSLPAGPNIPVFQTLDTSGLEPDYYDLAVSLVDGQDRTVAAAQGNLILSPAEAMGHPIANAKGISLDNRFLFLGMLASEYARLNDVERAGAYYQKALALKPDYLRGYVDYAQFLLKAGRIDQCLEAVEKFRDDANLRFEYFSLRGRALKEASRHEEAVAALLEANKIYNSDTGVLNALGFSFHKLGRNKEALAALESSLKMNPNQEDVKSLAAEVSRGLK
ncbi:MAG: hypothetical protein A2W03_16565 [Candidatus Aminicenantes bacterium RBG_16_63_16]|nr:MAG: hypothetical protein A2W03_16565 [Candidatus Aminicenantes bacterium RBG_16_63_16]